MPLVSNCVVGSEASWTVREPSLQRRIRAFDCSSEGFLGERRHRSVVMAVSYGENVAALVLPWWPAAGGWKSEDFHALGSKDMKSGTLSTYICSC